MNYYERCKQRGIRLELSPQKARNCWKKTYKGNTYYFSFPLTKDGYEEALRQWTQIKSQVDGERPNASNWQHYRDLFERVQQYHDSFGGSATLIKQIKDFLDHIADTLQKPELPYLVEHEHGRNSMFHKEFAADGSGYESFGHEFYELPDKWKERIARLDESEQPKRPQTIGYWFERYVERTEQRRGSIIEDDTADDRGYKLARFKSYADHGAHITTIDSHYLETFHSHLDESKHEKTGEPLAKKSKEGYWKAFKMFVRWCSHQTTCELKAPENLDSLEFQFREPKGTGRKRLQKKQMLWTKEVFLEAISGLPAPYPCFLLLMLNCGFRHSDLGNLLKTDLHLNDGRIIIQREKLNQQETAPVISYRLWGKTIELIETSMSDDGNLVFVNSRGGSVEDSIKSWWKDNRAKYGLEDKRLDYIRKTGSTFIANLDRTLDEVYLGESLSTTARIHYSFTDGEPCKALDDGLAHLGAEFGFCKPPKKTIELSEEQLSDPKIIEQLKKLGIEI